MFPMKPLEIRSLRQYKIGRNHLSRIMFSSEKKQKKYTKSRLVKKLQATEVNQNTSNNYNLRKTKKQQFYNMATQPTIFFKNGFFSRLKKKQVLSDSNPGTLPSQAHSIPPDKVCQSARKLEIILNLTEIYHSFFWPFCE